MVILAEKRVPKLFCGFVQSLGEFCKSLGFFIERSGLTGKKMLVNMDDIFVIPGLTGSIMA